MAAVPPRVNAVNAGNVARSSDFNAEAAVGNFLLYDRPIARVRQLTAQTIQSATVTPMLFDIVDADNDGMRTGVGSSTDRLVCRTTGWYSITGTVCFPSTGMGPVWPCSTSTGAGSTDSFQRAPRERPTWV